MMKWIKRILLGLVAAALLAIATLYGWSAMIIGKRYNTESRAVPIAVDPALIERGERMAQVLGCFHGCHGADMEGSTMEDDLMIGRLVAPNLTEAVGKYSPAELEAIIRQGIRPDGTSVVVMPSEGFSIMTDEDLSAILSFIGNYPRQEHGAGTTSLGPFARFGLVSGMFWMAAEKTRPQPWEDGFRDDPLKLGEYLATMTCGECHGPQLEGQEGFTPPLTIAKAYSLPDFRKLMSTGIGLGDRDLGLMSEMGRYRFTHLTDQEVAALHAYLQAR